jgi:hypothetical protein
MTIDFNSAKINVDITGSAPAILARNSDPVIDANPRASDSGKSAINIQGSVDVHHSPGDDLSQFGEFRFIQLVCIVGDYALYAGATPTDGFVSYSWASPPAFPQKFAYDFNLDSAPESYGRDVLPFINPRAADELRSCDALFRDLNRIYFP